MPTNNLGKIFEQHFATEARKAKQGKIYVHRIKDSDTTYRPTETSVYTPENECDYLMYYNGLLYALELKSTKFKSVGFELDPTKEDKMIKRHQIKSLSKMSLIEGMVPGFIFNFRDDEDKNNEKTYFLHIKDFNNFCAETSKKSINETDIILHNGFPIKTTLRRTWCSYDIEGFIDKIEEKIKHKC